MTPRHRLRRRRRATACRTTPSMLEPAVRAELVDRLAAAGLPRIEAVSFVNPARVPQMAGAEEVVAALDARAGRRLRRSRRSTSAATTASRAAGLDEVHFAFAATETFNQRNQGAPVAKSVEAARRIVAPRPRRRDPARRSRSASPFGCPFEGAVAPDQRARPRRAVRGGGRRRDRPRRHDRRRRRRAASPGSSRRRGALGVPVGVHLHNTRNTGFANALRRGRGRARPCSTPRSAASAAARSRRGRPATSPPRTSSTCCTARASRPASTSSALIGVAEWLEGVLGRQLEGQVYRAGTFAPVAA